MPVVEGTIAHCQWSARIERRPSMRATRISFPQGHMTLLDNLMVGLGPQQQRMVIADALQDTDVIRIVEAEPVNEALDAADPLRIFPPMRTRTVQFHELAAISRERILNVVLDVVNGLTGEFAADPAREAEDYPTPAEDELEQTDECWECGVEGPLERVDLNGGPGVVGGLARMVCEDCRASNYPWCHNHRGFTDTHNISYNWDDEICGTCTDEDVPNVVRMWDYRPDLVFHPVPPEGDHPLYIGMELEASFSRIAQGQKWAGTYLPDYPDLLYAKNDSSVDRGFEIVTHPMQPLWAMENFPFDIFQKGLEEYTMRDTDESTGTHVHMNKDAFDGPTLWKFLQIHMKLPEFCGLVGGRGTDSTFGSFTRNANNFLGLARGELLEIVKRKGKYDNPERYIAVNLRNEYTLELRYMRGGMAPYEIKKNIQWALALFDFAKYLNISDVKDGALADPGYLLGYIRQREDLFPDLVRWIGKQIPEPLDLAERE